MAEQQWFVVPMAFGRHGVFAIPDPEGACRCVKACQIAQRIGDYRDPVWIVLGANMPKVYPEPFGEQTLADLAEHWLINRGWEPLQIIKNPKGKNTRTELLAIRQVTKRAGKENVHVRFVTSWWHAPRVWVSALFIFGRPVRVSMARTTLPWYTLARELPKEALKFLCEVPYTIASIRRERMEKDRISTNVGVTVASEPTAANQKMLLQIKRIKNAIIPR